MLTEILPILAFITSVLFVLALAPSKEQPLRQRLAPYAQRTATVRERTLAHSFVQRVISPSGHRAMSLVVSLAPAHIRTQAALDIARAGHPLSVDTYLALRAVALFGLPLAYVLFLTRSESTTNVVSLVVLGGLVLVGRRASGWWLKSRIHARQRQIERALPGALDLTTVCMEAGLSFDAALAKVVEKTRGPLADELAQALQEMQLGKRRRDALRDLANRAQVRDLTSFIAAVVQADQMGMSLGPVMRAQAEEVRTRRRQQAEEQAMKASIKMLIPLVLCMLPATFIVVLGPAIMTIATQLMGGLEQGLR